MNASLLWTIIGSVAGALAVVVGAWQAWLQFAEHRRRERYPANSPVAHVPDPSGLPVVVPVGRLPPGIHGRDALLAELSGQLRIRAHRSGATWVLAGMGGLGKSTVALAVAAKAQASGWQVWWVSAADATSFTGGILEVLYQLSAPQSVIRPVREGTPLAAERAWQFFNGKHAAGRRWLLIIDNADTPAILAAHGASTPGDHTGWIRRNPSGLVIVTTRNKDPRVWGPQISLRELRPLTPEASARILTDLAPAIPDPGGSQAEELGRRLGGLPLALHLAGNYLSSPFARWHSFDSYRQALESADFSEAMADLDSSGKDDRAAINRTWEFSLEALSREEWPQARPLLQLLCCYAPTIPVPVSLLHPDSLADLLTFTGSGDGKRTENRATSQRLLREGLHALATVGLLDLTEGGEPAVITHPVVADVTRSSLFTAGQETLAAVARASVGLLETAAAPLDYKNPGDWPAWQQLTPHAAALSEWLGDQMEPSDLGKLLAVSVRAAKAERRCGNLAIAAKIAALNVAKAERLGHVPVALAAGYTLGQVVAAQGHNNEAEQIYQQVFTLQRQVLGEDHPDTLNTRHHLASMISYQGRYSEAEKLYREVLAGQQRAPGSDAESTLNTRHHLAWMTALRGGFDDARRQFQDILADQRRALGDEHPETLKTRHGLAWISGLQGHYGTAEQEFRQVLGDQRRVLGDDHPNTIDTRYRLARAVSDQARLGEAREMYGHVLADLRRVLGDDHPATLSARDNLARVTGLHKRYRDAEQMFLEVLADRERLLADKHPHTLVTRHRLAWVVAGRGRLSEAERMFREVLADRVGALGPEHPDTLSTRHRLAEVIASQGRNSEAEQLFRETLAAREKVLGYDHPDTVCTRKQTAGT